MKYENAGGLGTHKPEQALACGQPRKFPLQLIHSIEVGFCAVIAAPLLRGQSKAAGDVCVAGAGAAEVNQRGQILFLLERGTRS